jgi:GAF domain-containing protein
VSELEAAVSAGVLGAEGRHRELLRSIVEVARAIFGAKASSILLLDEAAGELVFEAVAGEGEETLVGTRLPAGTGLAGWVLATRQPIVVEDLDTDPRFARDTAAETGFVPKGLMAVPLLDGERALGVLEVLDRPQRSRFSLAEMDLLGLFAAQAALALDLLQRARRVQALLAGSGDELAVLARLAERLEALDGDERAARIRLLEALEEVLRA